MDGEKSRAAVQRASINRLVVTNYVLIALVVALIAVVAYFVIGSQHAQQPAATTVTTITAGQVSNSTFGHTLARINSPFNATELAIINNAPNSYYETAGAMLVNGTLPASQIDFVNALPANASTTTNGFSADGKPSVIYIGALSCVYCGENRWAMAMALSRFGSFSSLYYGYSSFGDYDLPTIYWEPYNYTTAAGVAFGNSYNSNVVNFISADYESPITQSFQIQPISFFVSRAPNSTVANAMDFMNSTNRFAGTPFTLWGNYIVPGADAVILGNATYTGNTLQLEYMTHAQVLGLINRFDSQFAYSEYAAADVYAAMVCASTANKPQFCSLPFMPALELRMHLG